MDITDRKSVDTVFGDGLIAYAVKNASCGTINSYALSGLETIESCRVFRDATPYSSARSGGLSARYHGVTPISTLSSVCNRSALATLGLPVLVGNTQMGADLFVPFKVPRPLPQRKQLKVNISEINKILFGRSRIFICLSAIPNILLLQRLRLIEADVPIRNDVVFKIGTIESRNFPFSYERSFSFWGVRFPAIKFGRFLFYLRPQFFCQTEVNFFNIAANLQHLDGLTEKLFRMVYARFGLKLFRVRKWEVVCQANINDFCTLSRGEIVPGKIKGKSLLSESLDLASNFFNIEPVESGRISMLNGIHYSYDRAVLRELPCNLSVFDTSLSHLRGEHTSIDSYCAAFNAVQQQGSAAR